MKKIIKVKLKNNPYPIIIENNGFSKIGSHLKSFGNFALIITSNKVHSLYKSNISKNFKSIEHKIISLPDGEAAKSQNNLLKIIDGAIKSQLPGRKLFIAAIGGGTIGDVSGFAAAIYKRGIQYVQIPTTLLAQIDSSIGGKTAINYKQTKNILGAFYQPKLVLIDPSFLKTLTREELNQGIAEAIKYGAISDRNLFNFIANNKKDILAIKPSAVAKLILSCVKIKAEVVEKDELETKGLRTILNFGHTLGHAIEGIHTKTTHGEAVAIGMAYAVDLSVKLKLIPRKDSKKLTELIEKYDLKTSLRSNARQLIKKMTLDKKFTSGKIRMVLLKSIGQSIVIDNIPESIIKKTLADFLSR